MSKPNNSLSPFQPSNIAAKSLQTFQHHEVAPQQMQNCGLSGETMARRGASLAKEASEKSGLAGAVPGAGAGLLAVGAVATLISAPVTLPVLAIGALIGGFFGFLPKKK